MTIILVGLSTLVYSIPFTGGELNYKFIKDGLYEFTLVLERDCGRFGPQPEFSDKVTLGVFNLENELLVDCGENGRIPLNLERKYRKEDNLNSGCVEIEDQECREVAVYKGTVEVPISAKGYQFVYSSCCRPDNIENILDPENTGFTLVTTMTLNGYLWYTSIPSFDKVTPLYSCINEEEVFDPGFEVKKHEEYKYSLCTPYDGEAPNNENDTPDKPPYENVGYKNGFDAHHPFGNNGDLSIDENTGIITYTNSKIGSYNIAICVEQYKKGRLVGSTIKEIQLNFVDCSDRTFSADFDYTVDFCNPGRVMFENRSFGATSYSWRFYTDDSTSTTSSNANPVMTFPGPGMYMVELAVSNDEDCVDTARKVIEVYSFEDDIEVVNVGNCNNLIQELSLNKDVRNYNINWFLIEENGSETSIGTGTTISYEFPSEGDYGIKVTAESMSCTVSATDTINVIQGLDLLMDTIDICEPGVVYLNPDFNENYIYQWNIDSLVQNPNSPNPMVLVSNTTLFPVTITDGSDETCTGEGFVLVRVGELPVGEFSYVQDYCSEDFLVSFLPEYENIINYKWEFEIGGEVIESTEFSPEIEFPAPGYYNVRFYAETEDGCQQETSKLVEVINPETDFEILNFGNCDNFNQVLKLNKNVSGYSITWSLIEGDEVTEIGEGNQITYDFGSAGMYSVEAVIENEECTFRVSDILDVFLGVTVPMDTIDICTPGEISLNPSFFEGYNYTWTDNGLIEDTDHPNPSVFVNETTRFEVTVSDKNDPACVGTGFVLVRVNERPIADFTNVADLCSEDLSVVFSPVVENLANVRWEIVIGGEIVEFTENNPNVTFPSVGYYRVTMYAETYDGCTDSQTRIVEVYNPETDLEILNFGNCEDYIQFLQLNKDVSGYDIIWNLIENDAVSQIGQGELISYDFEEEGRYEVQAVISNEECTFTIQNPINVFLGVTVPMDTIDLCTPGEVYLNPGSFVGYTYNWIDSTLIENPTAANPLVFVDQSNLFEVIVTDRNDPMCVDTGFVLVRFNEVPVAGFDHIYDICDVTRTVKFRPQFNGLYSTKWFFDGNDLSKTSTAQMPTFTYDSFGEYEVTLIAETADGCVDTVTQIIEVGDFFNQLDFSTNGGCEGLDYTFVLNDPAIGYTVNWYLDNNGALDSIGTGTSIDYSFEEAGQYDIRVELENDECGRSFVRRINITDGIQAPDTTIIVCEPGLIALNPFGRNDLNYEWTPSTGLDNPNSYNPIAEVDDDITYAVEVSLEDGDQICTDNGEVVILLDDSADSIAFDTSTITICEGDLVYLNPNGDSTLNYYWQPEAFFEDSRVANPSARLYTSQEFVVTITDPESGCSNSFRKNVIVIPIDDQIDIDYSFECGETIATLVALDVPDSGDIEWEYNDSIISTEPSFVYDFGEFGTFELTVRLTGDECVESTTLVTLIDPDSPLFNDTIYLCDPQSVELNPGGDPNLFYNWTGPNIEDNTIANPIAFIDENSIYEAIIIHPNDTTCTTTGRVTVFIEADSDIIFAENTTFCMGDTAELLVGGGRDAMNIQWYNPDGVLMGTENPIRFLFEDMGEYSVVAEINGCTFRDTINLSFRNIELTASQTDGICPGDEVILSVEFDTEEAFDSIVWSDGVEVSGTDPRMGIITPDSNTIVTAFVYFSDGCLSMDTVMLRIPPALQELEITSDRDTVIRGEKATLTAVGGDFESYQWEPADLVDNPDQAVTEVIPPETTEFMLTVVDSNGCSITKSITIFVLNPQCEPPYIFVPRAFTPNQDGTNDILYVRGESIDEVEFIVYNRWGQKVFETNDLSVGWDGTFRGEELAPDVYGYYLNVLCIGGDTYEEKGNVTIIR